MKSNTTATTQIGARSRSFSAHLACSLFCSRGNFRFPPFPSLKFKRPIRTTLAAACCRATLSDRHATLTSAPSSALSLGMCICCVPMLPTYLPARILYVRVIFSDPRIRGGIGLVGCSGILGKNITRVLSNLPSCKMHPATTYSLA